MKSSDSPERGQSVAALILCAGSGTRTGLSYNKILHYVGKKTVLETVLDSFTLSYADSIYVVINPKDEDAVKPIISQYRSVKTVYGGDTRTQSVRNGLAATEPCDIVVIHDGARPFVTPALINQTIKSAMEYGSGVAVVPMTDTVKILRGETLGESIDRDSVCRIQTPQAFSYPLLCAAYERVEGNYTDDSEVYALAGNTVRIVRGDESNRKITTPTDLFCTAPQRTKIGIGFDVHKLVRARKLVLGGVTVPHEKGLLGHSDADVLTHAIMDALLSAAGLPDIGVLFPDNDPTTESIDSMVLLDKVVAMIAENGFKVGSVSAVVMAQRPKLSPHIPAMRDALASHLNIKREMINVSATTTETLGIIGEEKGIAASAQCTLLY